jgi:DNA invertase Pin-like site-specific DNA recombinase
MVGDISCLVVTELGRLCPSVAKLRRVVTGLDRAGARLVSLNPALDTGTESGRAAMRILCAISDWERAARPDAVAPVWRQRGPRARGCRRSSPTSGGGSNECEAPG